MSFSSLFTRASANSTANARINDVIGSKTDAAAAVGTTKSIMANVKKALEGWQCVEKSDGAILSGSDDLFTISGGPVLCSIWGMVTTLVVGASNLRLTHTTTAPAATVNLNAGAVAVDDDAVGTIYCNVGATSVFTPSSGLGFKLIDPVTVEDVLFFLAPGTVKCLGSAARTGVIAWYMSFRPLSPSSRVVAAA